MRSYNFYGWETATVKAITDTYKGIETPWDLYDALSNIWCADTCAPRMRADWSLENKTLGQCSITAFLAQDIFGGEVYGVSRSGGNFHCYNVIGDCVFDLTSEQFGDEKLVYEGNPIQTREVHFAKEEKRLRYEYLKSALMDYCDKAVKRANIIDSIVAVEFKAFDRVQNEGGRAYCQDDWHTFRIMRMSQYMTWPDEMLETYLSYFTEQFEHGRNMITEKYARMMESTAPDKYAEIEDSLPVLDEEGKTLVNQIVAIQVAMMEEFAASNASAAERARSIHSSEDTAYNTSYETYLRGEISTYSDELLAMYAQYVVDAARSGVNLAETIMGNTAMLYGLDSIS